MALRLCVTSLIVMEHVALFVSFAPEATAGIIQTNQNYYYVGENITLHCFANTKFVDLKFTYGNDIEVPMKYVTVINDTYARMDRPAMAEDYAKTTYVCWLDFNEAVDVDTQTVETEYPPQNVTNITYVFYNKKEVQITWNMGIPYKNYYYVSISVDWSSDQSNATSWKACTSFTLSSCAIDVTNETSLTLRVTVTNVRRRDTVTQVFQIYDLNDHVKPGPVTILKNNTSNSTCVSLTWRWTWNIVISKFIVSYGLMNAKQENRNIAVSETNVTICDLRPFRNYSFEVRAVPERKGYASDPKFLTVQTDEDVPQFGPQLITSGYSRNLSCEVGNNENVFIYFQPVPENDANGILTHYCITDVSDLRNCILNNGTFTFKITVPCKKEFKAFLQAETGVGFSPNTTLTVPFSSREEELLKIAKEMKLQIRSYEQRRIIATWEPPTDQHKYSVYLYYCQKQDASKVCKGTMNYIPLNVSDKMTSLNNVDADLFGLSLVTVENVTSGIVFTNCVYNPLVPEVYDLDRPSVKENLDFVLISWKYRLCHRDKMTFTNSYSVSACEDVNCCKQYRIEGGNITDIKVSDLKPGINYNVTVSASIATGNSNPSEIGYALLQPKVPDELSSVVIVIGVFSSSTFLVVLLVSVLVSYWARKMYLTRKRKLKTTHFPKPRKLLLNINVKGSAETAALLEKLSNRNGFGMFSQNSPNMHMNSTEAKKKGESAVTPTRVSFARCTEMHSRNDIDAVPAREATSISKDCLSIPSMIVLQDGKNENLEISSCHYQSRIQKTFEGENQIEQTAEAYVEIDNQLVQLFSSLREKFEHYVHFLHMLPKQGPYVNLPGQSSDVADKSYKGRNESRELSSGDITISLNIPADTDMTGNDDTCMYLRLEQEAGAWSDGTSPHFGGNLAEDRLRNARRRCALTDCTKNIHTSQAHFSRAGAVLSTVGHPSGNVCAPESHQERRYRVQSSNNSHKAGDSDHKENEDEIFYSWTVSQSHPSPTICSTLSGERGEPEGIPLTDNVQTKMPLIHNFGYVPITNFSTCSKDSML